MCDIARTTRTAQAQEVDFIMRMQRGVTKELDSGEAAARLRMAHDKLREQLRAGAGGNRSQEQKLHLPQSDEESNRQRVKYISKVQHERKRYDLQWEHLIAGEELVFDYDTFPWPLGTNDVLSSGNIQKTRTAIARFLLDGVEPEATRRAIRKELKRWHPDKFQADERILNKVIDEDRERVKAGSELVARCLNELL